MIPLIPTAPMLLPIVTPVIAPARRCFSAPSVKIGWRIPVVAHRDAQDIQGNHLRGYKTPRPVVPGTRVPVVALINPVHAIVKEEIRILSRRIIDRIAGNPHEFRVRGHVDADINADLGHARRRREKQHPQHNEDKTHFPFPVPMTGFRSGPPEGDATPSTKVCSAIKLSDLAAKVLCANAQRKLFRQSVRWPDGPRSPSR